MVKDLYQDPPLIYTHNGKAQFLINSLINLLLTSEPLLKVHGSAFSEAFI